MSCHEVYLEIEKQRDELFTWVKKRRGIFLKPTEDLVNQFGEVMHNFPNFAATGGSSNQADPWLISQALLTRAIVVSDESLVRDAKPTKPPKIPNVCAALGLKCIRPWEFLRDIGFKN